MQINPLQCSLQIVLNSGNCLINMCKKNDNRSIKSHVVVMPMTQNYVYSVLKRLKFGTHIQWPALITQSEQICLISLIALVRLLWYAHLAVNTEHNKTYSISIPRVAQTFWFCHISQETTMSVRKPHSLEVLFSSLCGFWIFNRYHLDTFKHLFAVIRSRNKLEKKTEKQVKFYTYYYTVQCTPFLSYLGMGGPPFAHREFPKSAKQCKGSPAILPSECLSLV